MVISHRNNSFLFKCILLLLCSVGILTAGSLMLENSENGDILLKLNTQEDVQLIPLGDDYIIQIDGYSAHMKAGQPDLPVFVKVLDGKPNESLEVILLSSEYLIVTQNLDVAAVEVRETIALGPSDSVRRYVRREAPSIYTNNVFWPEKQVDITEAWQGSRKLIKVAIFPVQYNPVSKVLRVCRKLEVILKTVPSINEEGPRGPIRPRKQESRLINKK